MSEAVDIRRRLVLQVRQALEMGPGVPVLLAARILVCVLGLGVTTYVVVLVGTSGFLQILGLEVGECAGEAGLLW
jgi:hypothetical protein